MSLPNAPRARRFRRTETLLWSLLSCACLTIAAGCTPQGHVAPVLFPEEQIPPDSLIVPGNQPWVDTGIDVTEGEPLTILGKGRIRIGRLRKPKDDTEIEASPQGTFLYNDALSEHAFPLPAAGRGPAPCFCLIGRIGHSEPFYVGEGRSWTSESTGRLYLGINDFDPASNVGEFYAEVRKPQDVQPLAYRQNVPLTAEGGEPVPGCSVIVFYVDGLRPDVVEEMAAMHHIPHIRDRFVEGGAYLRNAFTAFPSDTITSNGTMWTGCFSDRHGLKGQVRFSRARRDSDSFLEPLGPNRSSRILGPQGLDWVVHETQAATVGMVQGEDGERQWRESKTSATPAIYDYMRGNGSDWATGILPIMTDMPPVLWTRSMARFLPYLQSQQAWRYVDDANVHYAIRHLIRQNRPVTIIWMPETDSVSHKECRGQFGSTRKTIARADNLIGEVVTELQGAGRLDSTYLILVSDHGHHGGQTTHLSRFDVANEFFFNARKMSKSGQWVGGGFGLSVRQHRSANWHKGDTSAQFVFVDGDSDGAARIFLPRGSYTSGDWSGANAAANLLAYQIAPHIPPLNMPLTLANATAIHDDGSEHHPVDLVLMKLSENSILITTWDRGQAVIERQRNEIGAWEYRYTPVGDVIVDVNGGIALEPTKEPNTDPLGITARVRPAFLKQFHDEQTWLLVTTASDYPDSVVVLTRHMLWQEGLRTQEQEYAPDLVVTARRGWLFGTQNTPGTTHGYPLAESMHATWYVSGPNIRRGATIDAPCRLVDLTPTILHLTGTPHDPAKLDGHALRNIFETGAVQQAQYKGGGIPEDPVDKPLYWKDVDLQAWRPLNYTPTEVYEHLPLSINNPNSAFDINNLAYDAMSVSDWSVFRLMDDILSPLIPGRTRIDPVIEKTDRRITHYHRQWVGDGVRALNIPGVSLADYSMTSIGNIKRVDQAVDWVQERGTRLDNKLAAKTRHRSVLGSPVTNKVIDTIQGAGWECYRFVQRIAVELLDEVVLNGIENGVDKSINVMRSTPSEVQAE